MSNAFTPKLSDELSGSSPPAVESSEMTWMPRWSSDEEDDEVSDEELRWPRRTGEVMLEGYVEAAEGADDGSEGASVARTKSLTDEDLEELKGCVDLGFGFSYEEIPELCSTLPALELCYSMSQRFLDEQHRSSEAEQCASPIANWKISSPGDDPEEVKARLRYWAQAVACTVKLCN